MGFGGIVYLFFSVYMDCFFFYSDKKTQNLPFNHFSVYSSVVLCIFIVLRNRPLEPLHPVSLNLQTHHTVTLHLAAPVPGNHHSTCCLYESDYCKVPHIKGII